MRSAVIVTSVALVLVTLLNVSLHTTRVHSERAVAGQSPELQQLLVAHARFELLLAILASLIFLVGVFVVTILETHKTAGAAFHIGRELERVRDGLYGIQVRLRRGDNLGTLAASFNEMTRALAERTVLHAEELEHAASEADRIESPPEAAALARALREMADERRRMIAAPDA
jgi:nitrogen fixation/metabolism regulation signal transduction histidine kinase